MPSSRMLSQTLLLKSAYFDLVRLAYSGSLLFALDDEDEKSDR